MLAARQVRTPALVTSRRRTPATSTLPSVAVIVPARNSERTIRRCLESLLHQDYPHLRIYLVAGPTDCDGTIEAVRDLWPDPRLICLEWLRPEGWQGRDGNARREFGARAALSGGAQVIAFIDSKVVAPPDWLWTGVLLLSDRNADAVAGVSQRLPGDSRLASVYQDGSLVSEWPRYRSGSWLDRDNLGRAGQLPVTQNLIVRSEALRPVVNQWPRSCPYGWEDFHLSHALVRSGTSILCTNQLSVHRLHEPKFRLAKHVTSGLAAANFLREFPGDAFARRRLLFAAGFVGMILALVCAVVGTLLLDWTSALVALGALLTLCFISLSLVSVRESQDWRGVTFPLLDLVHVSCWVAGLSIGLSGCTRLMHWTNQSLSPLR